MNIKPLHQLTRADITRMAQEAADRGEPVDEANVFGRGTANWRAFNLDFFEHQNRLVACEG
jgi:hypothetical protein